MNLSEDLLWQFLDYLGLDALAKMRQLNRGCQALVDGEVKGGLLRRRVEAWLRAQVPNWDLIWSVLEPCGALVSGGCLLTALMPEVPCRDIDIFLNGPTPSETLKDIIGRDDMTWSSAARDYAHNDIPVLSRWDIAIPESPEIQLIQTELEPSKVVQRFDFDILRNYYNGQRLVLGCPTAIATKKAVYQRGEVGTKERYQYRCLKYRFKGFIVSCPQPCQEPQPVRWTDGRHSFVKIEPEYVTRERQVFRDRIAQLLIEQQWQQEARLEQTCEEGLKAVRLLFSEEDPPQS